MNSRVTPAPSDLELEFNRLMQQGRYEAIVQRYNALPRQSKREIGAINACACALIVLGDYRKAIKVLSAAPFKQRTADIWNNLGVASLQSGKAEEALAVLDRALNRFPDDQPLLLTRSKCLTALDRFEEAYDAALSAVVVAQDGASLYAAARASEKRGRMEDAIEYYRAALAKFPDDGDAAENLSNLYTALFAAGRTSEKLHQFDEAIEYYRGALDAFPDDGASANNLNSLYMRMRRFTEAWDLAEVRMYSPNNRHLFNNYFSAPCPAWDGGPLTGRRLHVIGDQGVGDEIMFSQFLLNLGPLSPEKVIVYIDPRMIDFFTNGFDVDFDIAFERVSDNVVFAEGDLKVALSSLPNYLARSEDKFPRKPFLLYRADGPKIRGGDQRPVFGLSWWSSGVEGADRSLGFAELADALCAQDADFLSLQYNPDGANLDGLKALMGDRLIVLDDLDCSNDFVGFAKTAMRLDGIVSIPNTTAHIAGAIGVPTGVLLPADPSWRYVSPDEHMIWYGDHVWLIGNHGSETLEARIKSFIRRVATASP